MRSLRVRLFIVLIGTFLLAWATAILSFGAQLTRERTGSWDSALSDIAREILLSIPSDVHTLSGTANLRLGADSQPQSAKMRGLGFQVWTKPRRDLVMKSSSATTAPLKQDFVDGYGMQTIAGVEWRVYAISDAQNEVQVQVGKPTAELTAFFWRRMLVGLGAMLVLLAVVGVAMWVVIYRSLRPVVQVQQAIISRDSLNLDPLPSALLPDEVRPLVEAFNRLLGRVDQTLRNERQFITEAAHELRTPLAVLLTNAQVALRSKTLEESKSHLLPLVRGVERTARLSQQLLDLARLDAEQQQSEKSAFELADIVVMITREFETMAAVKQQTISLNTEPSPILGDINEIGVLVSNLVDNAIRYSGIGARVSVRCGCDLQFVRLSVCDSGPGVAEEDRARIFDRFFRVPGTSERGSGIGLSLVARIAASHGASIETGKGPDGRGFAIAVSFPVLI